jgi:plasmid stabilization system protein ParE
VKFRVVISRAASKDVDRLEAWLLDKKPNAAVRVGGILRDAIASLEDWPERGRLVAGDTRELDVKFGRGTYVMRFYVSGDQVVVTRIFHGRERR